MNSDQSGQFSWDQAKEEIQCCQTNIIEVKKDMIKLPVSMMQSWFGCDKLKDKLIRLLEKIEVELELYKRYIKFKTNQFKNKIQRSMMSKYLMQMNSSLKHLLGACSVVFVVSGAVLGLEYTALIASLSVGARTAAKWALGISGIAGFVFISGDFIYSLWQASKNKQNFEKVIKQTDEMLSVLETKKKNLQ